jgi:hypothetical protein
MSDSLGEGPSGRDRDKNYRYKAAASSKSLLLKDEMNQPKHPAALLALRLGDRPRRRRHIERPADAVQQQLAEGRVVEVGRMAE